MTLRSILRLLAGFALLMLASAAWSTPGSAHEAHHASMAAAHHAGGDHAAATKVATSRSPGTASAHCVGHAGDSETTKSPCCGNACHAAMSAEPTLLRTVSFLPTVQPAAPAPPELAGPTLHIKRPPRPDASPVG